MELVLPNSPVVLKLVAEGGPAITFLKVAMGLLSHFEEFFLNAPEHEYEVSFLRDCLMAPDTARHMPCVLVDDATGVEGELNGKATPSNVRTSLRETYSNAPAQSEPGPKGQKASQPSKQITPEEKSEKKVVSAKVDEAPQSNQKGAVKPQKNRNDRKDRHLRGALQEGSRETDAAVTSQLGLPWMGVAVPRWPVPNLPLEVTSKCEVIFQDFNNWNFDVFAIGRATGGRVLQFVGWEALYRSACFSQFHFHPIKSLRFLERAEALYKGDRPQPYHNNVHAADVTQTMQAFIKSVGIGKYFDPLDHAVSILSAIIHDMGHDGKNNAFHVNTRDELALTYNDKSVLENFHVATAFKMFNDDVSSNMLDGLPAEQLSIFRKEVIDMVLGTDMTHHFTEVGNFKELINKMGTDPESWQADDHAMTLLRGVLLHTADISNPTKPFYLARLWAARCLTEFFVQGAEEIRLGVPVSPLCDRETTEIPASQLGFIRFIVQPTYEALATLTPTARKLCLCHVTDNIGIWERMQKDKESFDLDALVQDFPTDDPLAPLASNGPVRASKARGQPTITSTDKQVQKSSVWRSLDPPSSLDLDGLVVRL